MGLISEHLLPKIVIWVISHDLWHYWELGECLVSISLKEDSEAWREVGQVGRRMRY